MPSRIYERNAKNTSGFTRGGIPHNKGKESERKVKRIDAVKKGQSVECKIHGIHSHWRYHSRNNVQCKTCAAEWQRKRKKENPLKEILKDAKRHTKKNNRAFEIDIECLRKKMGSQNGCCVLTGIKFDETNLPSLDRIDSAIGYIEDNIQLVLIKINRMKSDFCQNEFIDLCIKVASKAVV